MSKHSECSKIPGKSPLLSKPVNGESLFHYLAVSEYAVSRALIREEEKVQ